MKIKELKKILDQYNDNDIVVVEVHDTILYEDLYDFKIDSIKMDKDRKEIRICPKNHRDHHKISVSWCVDDVLFLDETLTTDQCIEVLDRAKRYHDANYGITYDTLECYIDQVKEEVNLKQQT